jgi:predicted transcriptional regulator
LPCSENILISVRPQFMFQLLAGNKTVELRRRCVRVSPGTRVWIYGTLPVGRVVGLGEVESVEIKSPTTIWKRFGQQSGITRQGFFQYFDGTSLGCAIVFSKVVPLGRELGLAELRNQLGDFTPPQFFRRISLGSRELHILEAALEHPSRRHSSQFNEGLSLSAVSSDSPNRPSSVLRQARVPPMRFELSGPASDEFRRLNHT